MKDFFVQLLTNEAVQGLLVKAILAVGTWVVYKVGTSIASFDSKLKNDITEAKNTGKQVLFANLKEELLRRISISVMAAEQTLKKEITEKYEDDKKLTKEDGKVVANSVYQTVWSSFIEEDQKLLEAGIADIKSFAMQAIEANVLKMKALTFK